MRTARQSTTGTQPYLAMYGRKPRPWRNLALAQGPEAADWEAEAGPSNVEAIAAGSEAPAAAQPRRKREPEGQDEHEGPEAARQELNEQLEAAMAENVAKAQKTHIRQYARKNLRAEGGGVTVTVATMASIRGKQASPLPVQHERNPPATALGTPVQPAAEPAPAAGGAHRTTLAPAQACSTYEVRSWGLFVSQDACQEGLGCQMEGPYRIESVDNAEGTRVRLENATGHHWPEQTEEPTAGMATHL